MKIYKRYEALSPIYQGGLTNHLPMILTALKKLGMSEEDIVKKLDQYREQKTLLDLTETTTPISEFEQAYINRSSYYLGEINRKGEYVIIGEFINKHKMNLGSALFHGFIRLAHAKEEQNDLLIAQALAYFELTSEDVEFNSKYIDEVNFLKNFHLLEESLKANGFSFKSANTMSKFKELLNSDLVSNKLYKLRYPNREFILDFVMKNYMKTNCFYNLHLITGFEALLELEEYIFDFEEVLNQFFLYAQVFVLFTLEKSPVTTLEEKPIENLKELINELKDAHDIKLFYSLIKLDKLFENDVIKTIANRIFTK
ncbi:hypothetical protein KQ51_01832 [Candidatus Izimaplasma bacterium HR1]|jgi:hypothetical protein|uniref:questin oxidase family protein n=1 Tax=Candidatus Izimoplasma sp. HR1 TaxID=1541959 RepID=UPI0004F85B60|nr:hypothetical protein KQ51_01832 [Candidatus Izimaplasma bacterium HR1]